ncbi:MAG: DMT family transporter [Rhodospirillales bacterium]|nr:DMT family transporter [Rhodospirillales bacterium]
MTFGKSGQRPGEGAWLALMPALFVLLWSTGFIGAKYGVPYASPLLFLTVRFGLTALLLSVWALLTATRWPKGWQMYRDLAVTGILLHSIYLGGVFVAISQGMPSGMAALVVSLQPLLVAALAGMLLGERVSRLQWVGLVLGLGGVALMVLRDASLALDGLSLDSLAPVALCLLSLVAITLAVLYQKAHLGAMPQVGGNVLQFLFATLVSGIGVLLFEPVPRIEWTWSFLFALAWLVLVLSIGAIGFFLAMVRRGAASKVSSLFFLVPPCTALLAWPLFGETLDGLQLAGMALAVFGVYLANRRS